MQDVISITLSARKTPGTARLATVTKTAEFMRVILGDEQTQVSAGEGYYCQSCYTQPKYDYHWPRARKCGALSGWFCAANGCAYDQKRMAGLITFCDKNDPNNSFVLNTRMPSGTPMFTVTACGKPVSFCILFSCGKSHDSNYLCVRPQIGHPTIF